MIKTWIEQLREKNKPNCPKCGVAYTSYSYYRDWGNGKKAALFIHSYDKFGIVGNSCLIREK